MKSIATQQSTALASQDNSTGINPEQLLMAAVQAQMPPETIQQLLDMRRQLIDEQAKKAYYEALPKFQAMVAKDPPRKLKKVTKNEFNRDSKQWEKVVVYRYAPLGEIVRAIGPAEEEFGFSHQFRLSQNGDQMVAHCLFTHRDGYTQDSGPFPCLVEDIKSKDGKSLQNAGQRTSTAQTYGMKNSLSAVTGIISVEDFDSNQIEGEQTPSTNIEPEPEHQATPLTDTELAVAMSALEQSADIESAWQRIAQDVEQRNDKDAFEKLKAFAKEIRQRRKKQKAKSEELKGRPQKQTSPGGGNSALVTEEEANKLTKRINSIGMDWAWFLKHFNVSVANPFNIPAVDYETYMEQLWNLNPLRNGIAHISLADCQRLHIELSKAGISGDEFKAYHGLHSSKDIELAEIEKYFDFSGILADRESDTSEKEDLQK